MIDPGATFPLTIMFLQLVDLIIMDQPTNDPRDKATNAIEMPFIDKNTARSSDWQKQGRIHGYPSRVRVGRGSNVKTACN